MLCQWQTDQAPNNVQTHTNTHTKVPHTSGSTLWHRSRARETILTAQERKSDAQREQLRMRDLIQSLNERAAQLAESRFQHEAVTEAARCAAEEAGPRQQERQQQQFRLSQLTSLGVPYTPTSTSSRGAQILKCTILVTLHSQYNRALTCSKFNM